MGTKEMFSVLVLVAGILLSDHSVNGQSTNNAPSTTVAPSTAEPPVSTTGDMVTTFEIPKTCPSYVAAGQKLCSAMPGISDLNAMISSDSLPNVCSHTMLQYACASVENISPETLYSILNCSIYNHDATVPQEAYSLLMSQIKLNTLQETIDTINMDSSSSITPDAKKCLINGMFEKLQQSSETLTADVLGTQMQNLYFAMSEFDPSLLECMSGLPVTCAGLQAVVDVLDMMYSMYDDTIKKHIGSQISNFINRKSCTKGSALQSIQSYYKSFSQDVNYMTLASNFGSQDMSSSLPALSVGQLGQYLEESEEMFTVVLANIVIVRLDSESLPEVSGFVNNLKVVPDKDNSYTLLKLIVDKYNSADDPLCKPKLKAIFEGKEFLLWQMNDTILVKFSPKDCSEYQDIYQTVDSVYDNLADNETKLSIYNRKFTFLNKEALKSGSACTYGLSSNEWVEEIIGPSISYFDYYDLIRLYSDFNGFLAISLLNAKQIVDTCIHTKLLTDVSPKDYELSCSALTNIFDKRGFAEVQHFLEELSTHQIQFVANAEVRRLIFHGIFAIVQPQFYLFSALDWKMWFNGYLNIFLPSITSEQLSAITNDMVQDCTNLKTIVQGFDSGYNYMSQETKHNVANWIIDNLRNETDRCDDGNGQWLNEVFMQFKIEVDITIIKDLNPDFDVDNSLEQLSASQLAEAVMLSDESRTNVTYMEAVMYQLTSGTDEESVQNLSDFYDTFNPLYEKSGQFSEEVKRTMCSGTTNVLSRLYTTMSPPTITMWYEDKMQYVISEVDMDILQLYLVPVGCESQKAFTKALSVHYDSTPEENKKDVLSFLTQNIQIGSSCVESETSSVSMIKSFFGNYSGMADYSVFSKSYSRFDAFEDGVMVMLTDVQIGDMMAIDKVYENMEKATKVFDQLKTRSMLSVQATMVQFSMTADKQDIVITDEAVGRYIVTEYFLMMKDDLQSATKERVTQLFTMEITPFIRFMTSENLQMMNIQTCEVLGTAVEELDKAYGDMSEATRSDIASWIMGHLKEQSLNGCRNTSEDSSMWKDKTMKSFFQNMKLADVTEVYPDFDVISVIDSTSLTQKAEYFASSEALTDVNTTMIVLESLEDDKKMVSADKLYSFLVVFNIEYEKQTNKMMTREVREFCMTFFFSNLLKNAISVTETQISSFKSTFRNFRAGITVELLEQIPTTISCSFYNVIITGLGEVIDQLSEAVQLAAYDTVIRYAESNYDGSADLCPSLYTDSKTYLSQVFCKFSRYATLYYMQRYYSRFNVYDVLSTLTGTQLGSLFLNTTAYTETTDAVQIISELGQREIQDITAFMSECTRVSKVKIIASLPDTIASVLFDSIKDTVAANLNTPKDFMWFQGNFGLLTRSMSTDFIQAIPMDYDCTTQSSFVEAFSNVFDKLDVSKREAVYARIKLYNQQVNEISGSACATASGTSSEWIQEFYGEFSVYGTIGDFSSANANFTAADCLGELNGVQKADYVLESGALTDEEAIREVFTYMDTTEEVKEFLMQLNAKAPEQLQNSPIVGNITSECFKKIQADFMDFQAEDWSEWTQVVMQYILYAVGELEVEYIPVPLPCDSYHALVKGFDKAYDLMTDNTKQTVYSKCMKRQMDNTKSQTGIRCGHITDTTREWMDMNFARFSIYSNYMDFLSWNSFFDSSDAIGDLSPSQMAEVIIEEIDNEELACLIAGRIEDLTNPDVNVFLDTFSGLMATKPQLTNVEIGNKLLSASISKLKSDLADYSPSDWDAFMSRCQPLLYSMNQEDLSNILESASCEGYTTVVKSLSAQIDNFSLDNRMSLFNPIKAYLDKQTTDSGACPVSGEDSKTAMQRLLGTFSVYVQFLHFDDIIPDFDGSSVVDILSPEQLASYTFSGDVLSNETGISTLTNRLSQMNYEQLNDYLGSFQTTAQEMNMASLPNANIRTALSAVIYEKAANEFTSFTTNQWTDFMSKFNMFIPSLTEGQVLMIPESISCKSYQSVISACNNQYDALSEDTRKAICNKGKSYLAAQKLSTGMACPVATGESSDWIKTNLGLSSEYLSMADIKALYPFFEINSASISYLTVSQLGEYTADVIVLSNKPEIVMIITAIDGEYMGEYLDAFNAAASKNDIIETIDIQNKRFLVEEMFCKLQGIFRTYTAEDYTALFQKLKLLSDAISSKALCSLPEDLSCDSLAAIVAGVKDITYPEAPEAMYMLIQKNLQKQKADTGVACTGNSMDSRTWIKTYFLQYIIYATYSDIASLYMNLDVMEVSDMLTDKQLASATTSSDIIRNSTAVTSLMRSFHGNMNSLYLYLQGLQSDTLQDPTLISNTKVRDSILMVIAQIILPHFPQFSIEETGKWINVMDMYMTRFNSTTLSMIPKDISCRQYQMIVSALDRKYDDFLYARKQDVADFCKEFLKNKAETEGDACTSDVSNTPQYAQMNMGRFCVSIPAETAAQFYPQLDPIVYTQFCSIMA